jgi:CDP-paratose 2-epimerase
MKYLITGGCGFVGSNMAQQVLLNGEELVVFDNLFRHGSSKNLEWLRMQGQFKFYCSDIRNYNDVETVISDEKPDYIFHLAGQVAMTTSLNNPRLDFETNALGTQNLLEAVRKHSPHSVILYSSTNKVYGDLEYITYKETPTRYICNEFPEGFSESLSLDFNSPYGCSKGAADQYLLDYYRMYGIKTVVFRHSSIYGENQHSTLDQGWVGWFCKKALDIKNKENCSPFTISGTGKQVRDVLHVKDVVNLYFNVSANIDNLKGQAFNIGGGFKNSLSLLELFSFLENTLDIKMEYIKNPGRISDQKIFIANNAKINKFLGWQPLVNRTEGITRFINWMKND